MFTITPEQMKKLHLLPPGERYGEIERLKYEYREKDRIHRESLNALDPTVPLNTVNPTMITTMKF